MNDRPKSKWYWRLLRRGLIGLAILATLVAAAITEEDWRAKHDWDAYQRAAEARGERLDIASVIPPPVPDDQNFFAAPVVVHALKADPCWTDFSFERYSTNLPTSGGNWKLDKLTDLKQWQHYFRTFNQTPEGKTNGFPIAAHPQTPAADVLLALSGFNPALEELHTASLRPYARMPLDYQNVFESAQELLPWLVALKHCAQLLELRIVAEEQDNQPQPALDDIKLLLCVNDSVRQQPFLVSHLVRLAVMNVMVQPIYEGLAQHVWSDAQLVELEQALAKEDFLSDYQFTMNGETVLAIDAFENQRMSWVASAFFYQNELTFARMHQRFIVPLVDSTNRIIAPAALRRAENELQPRLKNFSPYEVLARFLYPAIAKSVEKFAITQASVDLARVACALERYRLAHGEYPSNLDALAPQFIEKLPHDIINGQPLHYRRTDDGRFVLYSVGWNEKDDGGIVAPNKDGIMYRENGDWVWQYPAK